MRGTQNQQKKVVHPYDPLEDVDLHYGEHGGVQEDGDHVRYVDATSDGVSGAGFWADWLVQTAALRSISDEVEDRGGTRQVTIQAVLFRDDSDYLVVTDSTDERFYVRYELVAHEDTLTFR